MAVMNGLVIAIMKGIVSQPRCSVWRPVLACRETMAKKGDWRSIEESEKGFFPTLSRAGPASRKKHDDATNISQD